MTRRSLRVVLYPLTDIVSGSMSLPNKKGNFVIHAFKSSPARDPDMVIVAFDNFGFSYFRKGPIFTVVCAVRGFSSGYTLMG